MWDLYTFKREVFFTLKNILLILSMLADTFVVIHKFRPYKSMHCSFFKSKMPFILWSVELIIFIWLPKTNIIFTLLYFLFSNSSFILFQGSGPKWLWSYHNQAKPNQFSAISAPQQRLWFVIWLTYSNHTCIWSYTLTRSIIIVQQNHLVMILLCLLMDKTICQRFAIFKRNWKILKRIYHLRY